jgi:hypothetical protein
LTFFWRCLEVFGKDLVIWCWFLWVYSGVDCEEKVWLEVGRFGRYSWVLPGMVAIFGGVQVLDFIVGDVVGERPSGGNSASGARDRHDELGHQHPGVQSLRLRLCSLQHFTTISPKHTKA